MTKKTRQTFNYEKKINDWFGMSPDRDKVANADNNLIGIEIECEGIGLPKDKIKGWEIHEDGSLRGESAEYVFNGPTSFKNCWTRLTTLEDTFKENKTVIKESYRTSVHVHLNSLNMKIREVYNQIFLYIIFEDVMIRIAGEDRAGNLFCLRAKDAEFFLDTIRLAIQQDNLNHFTAENLRYSAVNPAALMKHGSLEFRAFRGTVDIRLIMEWVELLLAMREAAITKFRNPIELVQAISSHGPLDFAKTIFSEGQIERFGNDWEKSVFENMRLIQHAAYARDWAEPTVEDLKLKVKDQAPMYTFDVEGQNADRWIRAAIGRPINDEAAARVFFQVDDHLVVEEDR